MKYFMEIGPRIDGETLGKIREAVGIARSLAKSEDPIVGDDESGYRCGLCCADLTEERIDDPPPVAHRPSCPLGRARRLVMKLRPR